MGTVSLRIIWTLGQAATMPSQGMDKEMVNALSAAQQGKDVLAEMVVDLETQLDQTKSDKAAAYLDNSTLANEVRRFEGKLGGVCSERDRITEARSKEKSAFAQSIDELKSQMDAMSFDKEAATKALSRAEEAHRLEWGALDEQLSRSRKFNDNLNDQLAQNEQLHSTIALLSAEKDNLLKQKSGDHGAHIQELTVLRGAFNVQQNNTEAAVTQVRTEKSWMMIEIAELSEKLAGSTADNASLTSQLHKAELSAASLLAHNEELIAEQRFYESQGGFHAIQPR